jgi:hypothetical protein
MTIDGNLLSSLWIWVFSLLYGAALLAALKMAPWGRFRNPEQLHDRRQPGPARNLRQRRRLGWLCPERDSTAGSWWSWWHSAQAGCTPSMRRSTHHRPLEDNQAVWASPRDGIRTHPPRSTSCRDACPHRALLGSGHHVKRCNGLSPRLGPTPPPPRGDCGSPRCVWTLLDCSNAPRTTAAWPLAAQGHLVQIP